MMKNLFSGEPGFIKRYWYLLALAFISLLSFFLNFFDISNIGYGNAYYAAAIRSMSQNFHNFFFASFDPAGIVSVDKPPLGLWVQVLSVKVLGYHGWSMLLPQALAATGSCIMMYILVARYFGRPAGLISALVFALTPAVVVAARNNTMDMQLVFVLLIAVWFLFKAIEKSKWRYLFASALVVGLGFNIKMLQAYMILPAMGIVYLFFAKEKVSRRILAGVISIAIVGGTSVLWVAAVDLYPAGQRPYVGSSTNNTVMQLIMGHNGLERIYGRGGGRGMGGFGTDGGMGGPGMGRPDGDGRIPNGQAPDGQPPNAYQRPNSRQQDRQRPDNQGVAAGQAGTDGGRRQLSQNRPDSDANPDGSGTGPNQGRNGQSGGLTGGNSSRQQGVNPGRGLFGGGGAVGNEIGKSGPLRLWTGSMYGQITWLVIFVLFGIAACIRKFNLKSPALKQGVLIFWSLWLVIMYLFFSFGGFYHRYYLCMMAPGIAALAGIGLVGMFRAMRRKSEWRQWLLPVAFLSSLAIELLFVWSYPELRNWLVPLIAVSATIGLILMIIYYMRLNRFVLYTSTGLLLFSLLCAPFYWSMTATLYVSENITMPFAGPELASKTETPGMTPNQEALNAEETTMLPLEKYLVDHYREGSYLVVAQRANDVAQFIVDTGLPAVAYGGFLGSDNALTLNRFKELVTEGKITYVLMSGQGGGMGMGNSELYSYVSQNAALIDASEYSGDGNNSPRRSGYQGGSALYLFE